MKLCNFHRFHPTPEEMAGGSRDVQFAAKLRKSVTNGDVTGAKRLIKGGIKIDSTFWYESSMLHEAVASCNLHMVKLLLTAKPDINGQNKDGRTALHIACRHGNRDIFEVLIGAKADVNRQTQDKKSCLHVALWRKHMDLAVRLLECGANVDAQDDDGWSPLHWCSSSHLPDFALRLIGAGARLDIFDKRGLTPLHVGIEKNLPDLVKLLVKHGSDHNLQPKMRNSWNLRKESDIVLLLQKLGCKSCNHPEFPGSIYNGCTPPASNLDNTDRDTDSASCLKDLCRTAIRNHLRLCHNNKTILRPISVLGLPKPLQDYVTMKEELENG